MSAVFDPDDPPDPDADPAIAIRDAATLILHRGRGERAEVLLGKRASGHVFMPDKYVFPGGRVDGEDVAAAAASELATEEAAKLALAAALPPRAYGLAAVRETFEETGLFVAAEARLTGVHPAFAARGLAPALAPLRFIARAVTPPARARRFDARFFLADAEAALCAECAPADSPELSDLRWFPLPDALALDLPSVTRFILGEVRARLLGEHLAPLHLYWTPEGHRTDRL
jgi:8-oxo-dGTP pyrophosphatase MutT (NUDIX family)